MRVTVDHAALQRAVATLAPVFGGTTITYGPIGSVRLDTHRRTLRLTAYGGEAAAFLRPIAASVVRSKRTPGKCRSSRSSSPCW
jgi:hypothetical protein